MYKSNTTSKAISFGMAMITTLAMLMAIDALSFTEAVSAEWAKAPASRTALSCTATDTHGRG